MKLFPYTNQVTGHDCLLTTEDNVLICKVRNANELDFYLNMDKSLEPFTPRFRGTVDVTVTDDEKGRYTFEGHFDCESPPLFRRSRPLEYNAVSCNAKVKYRNLDLDNLTDEPEFRKNDFTQDDKHYLPTVLCRVGHNPWVERVHHIGRHVVHKGDTIPYIVLENICRHYEKPCIMDLKVGNELQRFGCSQEKIRKLVAKSQVTTLSSLGIKMSGLQVYQDGVFTCRDKFYGRGLSQKGLRECTRLFFSNGEKVRVKVVEDVLEKVSQIKTTLSELEGYRFFGSSIVVFYEGSKHCSDERLSSAKVDVKLIDFAHCSRPENKTPGPDNGFIFGLTNFISIMENIKDTS